MAAHDASWGIFRAELKRWMDIRRVTNRALAETINEDLASAGLSHPVDEQIIKRWRHSTSPPLQALKVIGRALGMSSDTTGAAPYDPTYLPRVMGILDTAPDSAELIEAAYRLQTLQAKIVNSQSALATATSTEGVTNIARAAADSGLACAIVPVHEGPPGYAMHVADRVDIRHPLAGLRAPDPATYPMLADALHDTFATPGDAPGFCAAEPADCAQWSIPHVARPRTSMVHSAHLGLPAVVVTSMTPTPLTEDIGALLALVLGYGFTSTRALALELVSGMDAGEELRHTIHDHFLYSALPHQRVWSHYGLAPYPAHELAPFRDAQGRVAKDLVHLHLVEDDASLHAPAGHTRLHDARDHMASQADELGDAGRVFTLPVAGLAAPEERWQQAFRCVLDALTIMRDLGINLNVSELHERLPRLEPDVAPQLLRWLADHEAPYVDPRHRTVL